MLRCFEIPYFWIKHFNNIIKRYKYLYSYNVLMLFSYNVLYNIECYDMIDYIDVILLTVYILRIFYFLVYKMHNN